MERDLEEEPEEISRSSSCDESSDGFEIGSDDLAQNIKLLEEFVAGEDENKNESRIVVAVNNKLLEDFVASGDENQNEATDDVAVNIKLLEDFVAEGDENLNEVKDNANQDIKLLEEFVASADENQNEADGNEDQAKNIKLREDVGANAGKGLETEVKITGGDDPKEGGSSIREEPSKCFDDALEEGEIHENAQADMDCSRSTRLMSRSDSERSRRRRQSCSGSDRRRNQSKRKSSCNRNRSRSRSKNRRRSRSRSSSRGGNGGRWNKEKPKVSKVLGVFGLNKKLTREKDLLRTFGEYGHVEKVALPCRWGENRGFGFITFRSEEEATRARDALNDTGE